MCTEPKVSEGEENSFTLITTVVDKMRGRNLSLSDVAELFAVSMSETLSIVGGMVAANLLVLSKEQNKSGYVWVEPEPTLGGQLYKIAKLHYKQFRAATDIVIVTSLVEAESKIPYQDFLAGLHTAIDMTSDENAYERMLAANNLGKEVIVKSGLYARGRLQLNN